MASSNKKTRMVLFGAAFAMLGLGFASKPLYDTFCKVTGYGGTTARAEANLSEIIDRTVTVNFDSNVSGDLPWTFEPEQRSMDVKLGQSGLAYYRVKNNSKFPLVGTATFNVAPIKAAPYFVKTECFCFTEQRIEAGQEVMMPVLFFVDPLLNEDERLVEITDMTLSYTFFEVEKPKLEAAAEPRGALN